MMASKEKFNLNDIIIMLSLLICNTEILQGCLNPTARLIKVGAGAIAKIEMANGDYNIVNTPSFNYSLSNFGALTGNIRYIYLTAYFVPKETGMHVFKGACSKWSSFSIDDMKSPHAHRPSLKIYLREGFRVLLTLKTTAFTNCQIDVKFPNGTEVNPISSLYLFREIGFYYLGDRYFGYTYSPETITSAAELFALNPDTSLKQPKEFKYYNAIIALRATDYYIFRAVLYGRYGNYSFEQQCDDTCNFTLTDASSNNQVFTQSNTTVTKMFSSDGKKFCLQAWFKGKGSLKMIRHYPDLPSREYWFSSGPFDSSKTSNSIPTPSLSNNGFNTIKITLRNRASLAAINSWDAVNNYEVYCYQNSYTRLLKNFTHSGALSKTFTLTGLKNYTTYQCKVAYFGKVDTAASHAASKAYNFNSSFSTITTMENFPTMEPKNLRGSSPKVNEIDIQWDAIPSNHHEGVLRYTVFYRVEDIFDWKSTRISKTSFSLRKKLVKGTYEFKVCSTTGAGVGPCSKTIEVWPKMPVNQGEMKLLTSFMTTLSLTNRALVGHVVATYSVRTVQECFQKCSHCLKAGVGCVCASFNLEHIKLGTSAACEINSQSADTSPSYLIERQSYQHYMVFSEVV